MYDTWTFEEKSHKKVTLCNANEYTGLKPSDVWESLRCMGKFEWEDHMSELLCASIKTAHESSETTADITNMFSREMIGEDTVGEYRMHHERVVEFLKERLFEVASETDDELRVNLKIEFKK